MLPVGSNVEPINNKENQANISNYILLNKRDESRKADRPLKDIANIDTSKYSDNLKSWVDEQGKMHFSNAN